jgi:uncharacterized protein (DUF1015 family)
VPDIAPFRGIRYDPARTGDLSKVVSPPYDVISESARAELEAASPYNVVRLVLPQGEQDGTPSKYTEARATLDSWLAEGALRADDAEALYVYQMRTPELTTRGLLAGVSLDEERGVLPHERTYDHIVGDRLALLRAVETNLDTIFCVYEGSDAAAADAIDRAAATEPLARFDTPDGIEHTLWAIADAADIATIARAFEKASVVIADGHHRWRTAVLYRDEMRARDGAGPWDSQLMYLVDATRFGPALLPIHRAISGVEAAGALERLAPAFDAEEVEVAGADELYELLARRRADGRAFAMTDGTRSWLLRARNAAAERAALPVGRSAAWRDLDVAVLHHLVFDSLLGGVTPSFVHHPHEATDEIAAGRASLAFLLAPMPFEAVRAVAEAGEAMPQKSTFFIPKPVTGVVLRPLR